MKWTSRRFLILRGIVFTTVKTFTCEVDWGKWVLFPVLTHCSQCTLSANVSNTSMPDHYPPHNVIRVEKQYSDSRSDHLRQGFPETTEWLAEWPYYVKFCGKEQWGIISIHVHTIPRFRIVCCVNAPDILHLISFILFFYLFVWLIDCLFIYLFIDMFVYLFITPLFKKLFQRFLVVQFVAQLPPEVYYGVENSWPHRFPPNVVAKRLVLVHLLVLL